MKLKCRINGKDYDLVQGCTFTENFNETLDSAVICIDQVPELIDLKPFVDVYIWNADEEFDGYYCVGDFLFIKTTIENELISSGTEWKTFVPHLTYETPYTEKPMFKYEIDPTSGVGTMSGQFWDIWFDRFLNYNSETINNMRYRNGRGGYQFLMSVTIRNLQGNISRANVLKFVIDKPFYDGTNVMKLIPDPETVGSIPLLEDIICSYDINAKTVSFNSNQKGRTYLFESFQITGIATWYDNYISYRKDYQKKFDIVLEAEKLNNIDELDIDVMYLNQWVKTVSKISVIDEQTANLNIKAIPLSIPYTVDIQLTKNIDENGKVTYVGSYTNTNTAGEYQNPSFWSLVDDIRINKLSIVADSYSQLPTFFKHMLVNDFNKTRLKLNNSYNNKEALFKYEIDLFSETKRLEKDPLPNVSVTQSILEEEKRSCWFYLEKFVDLYSPKYKKASNLGRKTWQYVPRYYVSRNNNPYLESLNPHIVTNLYEVFKDVICPEFSLTNPNLKDIISQIMITKDLIPIVFNDVIYGLDIGAEEYEQFDRNGTNFDVGSMSSDNYATDARREYGNALSQENSAHSIEYIGFRNPNGAFLTLEDIVLETRFPIYKINRIKMCFYRDFVLTDRTNGTTRNFVYLCKYDITPFVLQNVVRNTLSTNWSTFEIGSSSDPLTHLSTPEAKIAYVTQYKLCTVGYDIGSNKISGWGSTYEYLSFLWFKSEKSYLENLIFTLESIYPIGTEIFYSYLQTLNGTESNPENYDVDVTPIGSGLDSIKSFGDSNVSNKLKSIIFEIDYDAMYSGSILHSKEYIEEDDIVTIDNCSDALTLLEKDGLLEKEKMNRMSNFVYKIPARYDNQNGGATFDKVQKLATYDELTDSIIYSREYQIFDNVILANYESTHSYILKNYFTSVFARYRTYSYMSYSESVRRAENFREFALLSKNNQFYENESLFNVQGDAGRCLLSFLKPTIISDIGVITNNDKINCGYFDIINFPGTELETRTKYLSDINSFSSGNSVCFNIAMYDNISGGIYIDSMSAIPNLGDMSEDAKLNYKATQLWYQMPSSKSDAFISTVGIYVCNVDNAGYWKDTTITESIFNDNKQKFMQLPKVNGDIVDYQNLLIGKDLVINKDNKEIIDATIQFEYVSLLKDKENILFSPWVAKLNDMVGVYDKFEENKKIVENISPGETAQITIVNPGLATTSQGMSAVQAASELQVVLKIPANELAGLAQALEDDKYCKFYSASFVNAMSMYEMTSAGFNAWKLEGTSSNLQITDILSKENIDPNDLSTLNSESKLKINAIFSCSYKYTTLFFLGVTSSEIIDGGTHIKTMDFNYLTSGVEGSNTYYYFMTKLPYEWFVISYGVLYSAWNSHNYGVIDSSNVIDIVNRAISTATLSSNINISVTDFDTIDETNMVVIISTKRLKPSLVYNSYKLNENKEVMLPSDMFIDTNGFNGVLNGHTVPQVFSLGENFITVNAALYNDYEQDVKSIQYYYKDKNNWLHFVFGVNVEKNPLTNKFDNFNIYLSNVSKRNMKVYDDMHRLIGYARNYKEELAGQEYGTEQYYVSGKLKAPEVHCDSETEENFVITVKNNNSSSCRLSFTKIGFILELPVGETELIVNPTEPLQEGQIDVTEELGEVVENYLNEELAYDVGAFFIDLNGDYTNSDEVNVFETNLELLFINIVSIPVTVYSVGDSLDLEDAVITATYSNGTTANVVNECIINGYDMNTVGTQLVSVKYTFNGVTKTGSFLILVKPTYVADPVVNIVSIEASAFVFTIENGNDFAVTVNIITSSGSYSQNIDANTVAHFDTSENAELRDVVQESINAYLSPSGLEDSVDCYFERENITSDNVVILEANR